MLRYHAFPISHRWIRSQEIKIDGMSVSVKVKVSPDPASPDFDRLHSVNFSRKGACTVDQDLMKYDPVRIRFRHLDKTTSQRKLLWHENEHRSDV